MKRRLFTILSALSLLLFVAVVVLWVRSHHVTDTLGWHYEIDDEERWEEHGSIWVSSAGGVRYTTYYDVSTGTPTWLRRRPGDVVIDAPPVEEKPVGFRWLTTAEVSYPYTGNTYVSPTGDTRLGFGAGSVENDWEATALGKPERVRQRIVERVIPYWFLASASLIPLTPRVILAYRAHRRRRQRRSGTCPSCNYDLRATPGRCPECGAAPAKAF